MFKPLAEPPEGASIRKALRSPLRFLTFSLPPEVTASARSASSCVTGAAGGSGKMAVCLSQIYHELKEKKNSSFIKFETFPVGAKNA